jgi:hypothetical protein
LDQACDSRVSPARLVSRLIENRKIAGLTPFLGVLFSPNRYLLLVDTCVEKILNSVNGDLPQSYGKVREIGKLPIEEWQREIESLQKEKEAKKTLRSRERKRDSFLFQLPNPLLQELPLWFLLGQR